MKINRHELHEVPDCAALRRPSLIFSPKAFVIEHEKLENKIIEASVQWQSFESWILRPTRSITYIVAGSPDDEKAKFFAAYLVMVHKRFMKEQGRESKVIWEHVYNGFDNPLTKSQDDPTLIVIDNLTVKSNFVKLEKARDLITKFGTIPKIVVCAGEDPISFAAQRLHVACHGLAYFGSPLAKTVMEVI